MTSGSRTSVLIALVFGGIATFLVRALVQNAALSAQSAPHGTIVVARTEVPFGAPLTIDNLAEVSWPSADPLEGSFAKVSDLLKDGRRLALVSLKHNEPVLVSRVSGANQRATLSTQLGESMRAVTIRVDEVRGVAGFVLPGDRVDVILTRGEGGNQESTAYADVLMQNAKVLAVDQLVDERQEKPAIARAVTLEVTVQQAQKVALAEGIGHLSLALRQANGVGEDSSNRVTARDLGSGGSVPREDLAERDRRFKEMSASAEAAIAQANRDSAQKFAEMEARFRGEMLRQSATGSTPAASLALHKKSSIVNVIRNGAKTESYTVSAER